MKIVLNVLGTANKLKNSITNLFFLTKVGFRRRNLLQELLQLIKAFFFSKIDKNQAIYDCIDGTIEQKDGNSFYIFYINQIPWNENKKDLKLN